MYQTAINILKKIEKLGYNGYIIGGYPRDIYLGITNSDIDICSNIKENILKEKFNVIKSTKFGSFIILENNYNYEITLFRNEIYKDSRYPIINYVDTLEEDLKRRDFTINTLCIDYNGNYVDLMNAKKDIDNKIIKVVGDINQKIKEDPLRIIRALRFSSDLNFNIEINLKNYIINNKELLNTLTKSRINKEIKKVKNKTNFYNLIKMLDLENYIK